MVTSQTPDRLAEDARRGQEAFERVRPRLRVEDDGKFVAIDTETGDFEVDADDYAATGRLLARAPNARVWLVRAGQATAYRMGRRAEPGGGLIRGTVNTRGEAVLRLRVFGPAGADLTVDAVVDTGFTGSLVLPSASVAALGLARRSGGSATLADGTVRQFDVYAAELEWIGSRRGVLVSAVGTETLVGMRLLADHELRVEVEPGGAVEVRPLRP